MVRLQRYTPYLQYGCNLWNVTVWLAQLDGARRKAPREAQKGRSKQEIGRCCVAITQDQPITPSQGENTYEYLFFACCPNRKRAFFE
jgi:hypothetical protein